MIQIDFFDTDILKSLVPIKTMKPELVYFLINKNKTRSFSDENMKKAIMSFGTVKKVIFLPVDIYDITNIKNTLHDITAKHKDEEIYIDLSGGSELMSVCGYCVSMTDSAHPIYTDFEREAVIEANSGKIIKKIEHITLSDYLTAVNARRTGNSRGNPNDSDKDRIKDTAETVFSSVKHWQTLNKHICKKLAGMKDGIIEIPETLEYAGKRFGTKYLLDCFIKNGFLEEASGKNKYRFADEKSKGYLTNYGTWLELYIYYKAKEVFDDVRIGFIIDWNSADSQNTEDNEIDVIAMHKSKPIFMSCKMCKPVAWDVYEVGFLAKRLGGESAGFFICTTHPVKQREKGKNGIFKRIKKMNIGLVEASDLMKEDSKAVFDRAMKMNGIK